MDSARRIVIAIMILAILATGCQPVAPPPPTADAAVDPVQANVEVARRFGEEVWGQGKLADLEQYVAPDLVYHSAQPGMLPTVETLAAEVAMIHAGLSDTEAIVHDAFGEGDLVVVRWTLTGQHTGSIMGEEPTGRTIAVSGITINRFVEGRIADEWGETDMVGMLTQLGVMPPMGPMSEPVIPAVLDPAPMDTVSADQLAAQKEIARRITLELWGKGNLDLVDEFYSPDLVYYSEPLGEPVSVDALAAEAAMVHSAFSEIEAAVEHLIAAGDRVAMHWSVQGMHTGDLFGIPASGNPFAITGMSIHRFADGKIVEEWAQQDMLALLTQVGAIPPQGVVFEDSVDAFNTVTFVATDHAFAGPETIPAGWTRIQLVNQGADLHHAQLIRLEEGKTLQDFLEAMQAGPGAPPEWTIDAGGPSVVIPGEGTSAILDLEPGVYVLICFLPDENGVPHVVHGMVRSFEVVASDAPVVAAPEATITMELFDYNFTLSAPITPGLHTIRVVNNGPQPHEVAVVWLAPGATVEAFLAAFEPGAEGPPPGKPTGGIQSLVTGAEGYFTANFHPGRYLLICFIPDAESGAPHVAHGMVQVITVR